LIRVRSQKGFKILNEADRRASLTMPA